MKLDHYEKHGSTGQLCAPTLGPGFESYEAGSWIRIAEESHARTKRPSSASMFSIVVYLQLTYELNYKNSEYFVIGHLINNIFLK